MSILRTILHIATLGIVDSNEEIQRRNTPCIFTSTLTKHDFSEIAINVAKPIKRLTVSVHNEFVEGTVRTASGINTWTFKLDFNDYGEVTGRYWVRNCENFDSKIPTSYAEQLKKAIIEHRLKNYKTE